MGLGRGALLWLIGIPLPIIILLALFWHHWGDAKNEVGVAWCGPFFSVYSCTYADPTRIPRKSHTGALGRAKSAGLISSDRSTSVRAGVRIGTRPASSASPGKALSSTAQRRYYRHNLLSRIKLEGPRKMGPFDFTSSAPNLPDVTPRQIRRPTTIR